MYNIDEIMDMISWKQSDEKQKQGVALAKNIKTLNAFIRPRSGKHDKDVWDNCALIIANRTDKELSPYIDDLLRWLEDMNWPGAICIFNRLCKYKDKEDLNSSIQYALTLAEAFEKREGYSQWKETLLNLQVRIKTKK